MKSFSAFTYFGLGGSKEVRFVGHSWQDGGFTVDRDGNPLRDPMGNTVSKFEVTEIERRDADLVRIAYCGDEDIGDANLFVAFLTGEAGIDNKRAAEICAALAEQGKLEIPQAS